MVTVTPLQIKAIGQVLQSPKRPLKERFRALFTLRNIGGPEAIDCIRSAFEDDSALLKHELAYCLGQMQDRTAISILVEVLQNINEHPMVRHEAAEALGAIGSSEVLDILKKYKNDPIIEVKETCELALERIEWLQGSNKENNVSINPYCSVDPAPPYNKTNIEELKYILLDERASLFRRYRAMFSLRNIGNKEALEALCIALKAGSALFRHEIAFVLGQMQKEMSVPYLKESLENTSESEMVRHECAEALGAIATKDCIDVLKKYMADDKRVVRESCEIALDMCEYENSPEFQYANALQSS